MKRIFGDYAYGPGPRDGCWWDKTCDLPTFPALEGSRKADVAIIGAGFTGLNAALTLARSGVEVVVLDAEQPGFGASGRNGGFCCLGGGKASDRMLDNRFGKEARLEWRRCEMAAVAHVERLIADEGLAVDRHSHGETLLAHRPTDFSAETRSTFENYGVEPEILGQADLPERGFGRAFFGGMTLPIGFGLNPRKYLAGLLAAALRAGVAVNGQSAVSVIDRSGTVRTASGDIQAQHVIVATNGYSSDDVPDALRSRYMPVQSTVLVTQPIATSEQAAADWHTAQMCYDTRHLLHYFRLMPDGRFLFGMRGGLLSGPQAEARARARLLRDFRQTFPEWRHVEIESTWSGMVALSREQMPFAGPLRANLSAGLCYHGNGVAMGSYVGHLLAQKVLGLSEIPTAISAPMSAFPLGRFRRAIMPPIYAGFHLLDMI